MVLLSSDHFHHTHLGLFFVFVFPQRILLFEVLDHVYSARHLTFTRPKPNVPKHEAWKEFYIFEWQTPLGGLFCIAAAFLMFMLTLRCDRGERSKRRNQQYTI